MGWNPQTEDRDKSCNPRIGDFTYSWVSAHMETTNYVAPGGPSNHCMWNHHWCSPCTPTRKLKTRRGPRGPLLKVPTPIWSSGPSPRCKYNCCTVQPQISADWWISSGRTLKFPGLTLLFQKPARKGNSDEERTVFSVVRNWIFNSELTTNDYATSTTKALMLLWE